MRMVFHFLSKYKRTPLPVMALTPEAAALQNIASVYDMPFCVHFRLFPDG